MAYREFRGLCCIFYNIIAVVVVYFSNGTEAEILKHLYPVGNVVTYQNSF